MNRALCLQAPDASREGASLPGACFAVRATGAAGDPRFVPALSAARRRVLGFCASLALLVGCSRPTPHYAIEMGMSSAYRGAAGDVVRVPLARPGCAVVRAHVGEGFSAPIYVGCDFAK